MKTIEINQLEKKFKKRTVLKEVSCQIEAEKIYGLLGRNGVGKSTLLNILNNRVTPTSGTITLDGANIFENDQCLQHFFLTGDQLLFNQMNDMTVEQCLELMNDFYPDYDQEVALALLRQFNLAVTSKLKTLSTGYRSIVSIVLGLTAPVEFIFLDEPTQGLDANHRDIFYRELLGTYAERPRTFVLSTHLINEVATVIEEVIILDEGKILLESPVEDLLARGVSVTGPSTLVSEVTKDSQVIGKAVLGSEQTADVFLAEHEVLSLPTEVRRHPLGLQELVILLTKGGESA